MIYVLRYKSLQLPVLTTAQMQEAVVGNEVTPEVIEFSKISTIFTVIDGNVYQYSSATKTSGKLDSMECFTMMSDREKNRKFEDYHILHNVDEAESLKSFNSTEEVRDYRAVDYELNDGECVDIPNDVGESAKNGVIAGFLVVQSSDVSIKAIVLPVNEFEEFVYEMDVTDDAKECLLRYLMRR